jgi:hypothetical protein
MKNYHLILRQGNESVKSLLVMALLGSLHILGWGLLSEVRADQTLYVTVSHPQASDRNPGSQALPFKTIAQAASVAIANNKNQVGTKILIGAGTYRESLSLLKNGQETNAPITFEAVGSVIVSGSDVWGGWQKVTGTSVFVHSWPYAWGLVAIPNGWTPYVTLQDIVRRSEMVLVNGSPLSQVLSYGELKTGCFYVDESAQKIYIQPPGSITIENALVEVATRSKLFSASGKSNVTLKGITFQHASTALDGQAVRFDDSSNISIEGCQFRWNNWGGLGFGLSRNVTARRNVVNYNGGAGIVTWKTNTLVFEDNETSYNNWRGKKGGFTGWSVAGVKNLYTHGGTFLRHKSVGNETYGIWFDTDCENILVKQSTFCSNLGLGIYLEANQGPITIQNTKICWNKEYGIQIANSAKVNLENNIIYGNASSQIMVSGLYDLPRTETNWETGEKRALLSEYAAWKYNAIVGAEAGQLLVSTTISPGLWGHFVVTLASDSNLWFHSQNSKAFQLAGGTQAGFTTWKSQTGRDGTSTFADPRLRDPVNDDFRLLPDSPLLGINGWQVSLNPPGKLRMR